MSVEYIDTLQTIKFTPMQKAKLRTTSLWYIKTVPNLSKGRRSYDLHQARAKLRVVFHVFQI